MNSNTRNQTKARALILGALFYIGVLLAPIGVAGEEAVSVRYDGIVFATAADSNDDGYPMNVTQARAQGTFGDAVLWVAAEWIKHSRECPEGFDLSLGLVNDSFAYTLADLSQVFGSASDGWLCMNSVSGAYFGEVAGIYKGGTERYKEASGEYVSKFEGITLDPTVGFRSVHGTVKGKLNLR